MTALLPELDEGRPARRSGPLAVRITIVRQLPRPVLDAAARGEDVPLRDHKRSPGLVHHYVPIDGSDRDQALALLQRLTASSRAVQAGRWRVAIAPAKARVPA